MKKRRYVRIALILIFLTSCLLLFSPNAYATAEGGLSLTEEDIAKIVDSLTKDGDISGILSGDATAEEATGTVEIILLLTVLTLAPSILIMVTAFTRIVIVLSFTRNAMGTQQMPPNQVIVGLALFLSLFVMYPVYAELVTDVWEPYQAGEIETIGEALDLAKKPIRDFMLEQIDLQGNQGDLRTFMSLANMENLPETVDEIPTHVIIPAFVTSEIKTAFQIGFMIFIPFIVIDMIVASALMSMGMMMLPPVMISLPFKIMLFVLVDGWNLTITSLVRTFQR
ncbi:MAG: flagellar type III secretion system pore protein FliP [Oscillospiraceae bacterium]|nr:flagellar type III secretion system pore protein FliP [Oscillospiraceae bacterium]